MNLLNRTLPWVASLLIAATSVFGEDKPARPMQRKGCGEQGNKVAKTQMMPAYNAPSRIEVRGSWDLFATASFIYWQLIQDNMDVAFVDKLTNTDYRVNGRVEGNVSRMDFDYKPGFKVGLGLNLDMDNWDLYAEYTRLHAKNSHTTEPRLRGDTTLPLLPVAGSPAIFPTNAYDAASETWRCNLDFINLDLGRSYFVGTQLTFRPFFGVRGGFITQNATYDYTNTLFSAATGTVEVPGVMAVYNRARSWAVGPRAGANTDWMLGYGIRFFGNANADIMYTKYKVQNKTAFVATSTVATHAASGQTFFNISKYKTPTLRTHLDLELGLGWGSYFDNNNWHIDLSASYEMQVFFDQNMLNTYTNSSMIGSVFRPAGDLYAHGLTTTVRFDF